MFMSDQQNAAQNNIGKQYIFLKCCSVQILGKNTRKSKLSP